LLGRKNEQKSLERLMLQLLIYLIMIPIGGMKKIGVCNLAIDSFEDLMSLLLNKVIFIAVHRFSIISTSLNVYNQLKSAEYEYA